jgi:hypothetical protein
VYYNRMWLMLSYEELHCLQAQMDDKLMLTEKERGLNGPWLSFSRFLTSSIY